MSRQSALTVDSCWPAMACVPAVAANLNFINIMGAGNCHDDAQLRAVFGSAHIASGIKEHLGFGLGPSGTDPVQES